MLATIPEVIAKLEKSIPNAKALNYLDKTGNWASLSTTEVLRQVKCIAAALQIMGLKAGDKVAIMAPPSHLWMICDLGIMLNGMITVPIFPNISEDNFILEVTQSEAKAIFLAGPISHRLTEKYTDYFERIISLDTTPFFKEQLLYQDLLDLGRKTIKQGGWNPKPVNPSDTATIVYTSGTIAIPKGVELTHKNLVCQFENTEKWMKIRQDDLYLSILPLAHILGRNVCLTLLALGVSIYFLNDMNVLVKSFNQIKPTLFTCVPRLLEKIYNTVVHKIKDANPIVRPFLKWALNRAREREVSAWSYPFARFILYSNVCKLFGGKMRCLLSGGAPLNPHILNFFIHCGIPVVEGYGLTEACPVISNRPGESAPGTIGKAMPGVEVQLSPSGEIMLRGDVVMKGYYRNPQSTAAVLDNDGWLHTGDQGFFDPAGFLHMTGRISDKLKTSYGEFVDIPVLEELLGQLPFVELAVAIVENRPFVTCLLFPNFDEIEKLKKQMDLGELSVEEILRMDFIKREIDRSIQQINEHLNQWERVRNYRFIYSKAAVESGELSGSYKPRHNFIIDKYQTIIDEMYPTSTLQIGTT